MQRIEKQETTKVVEKVVSFSCDLCGAESSYTSDRWATAAGSAEIKISSWEHVDGDMNIEEFDCCPDCWESKIKPLFGAKPRTYTL